jgi:hypothetical protein
MLWASLQTLNSPERITDRPRSHGPSGGDKRLRSEGKDLHESTDDPAKSESDSISARSEFDKTYKKTQLYNREAKLDKNNS